MKLYVIHRGGQTSGIGGSVQPEYAVWGFGQQPIHPYVFDSTHKPNTYSGEVDPPIPGEAEPLLVDGIIAKFSD